MSLAVSADPRARAFRGALEQLGGNAIGDLIVLDDGAGNRARVELGEGSVRVEGGGEVPMVQRVVTLGKLFRINVIVNGQSLVGETDRTEPVRPTGEDGPRAPAVRLAPLPKSAAFERALECIPDLGRCAPDAARITIGGVSAELRGDRRAVTLRYVDHPDDATRMALALFLTQLTRCCDLHVAWFRVLFSGPPREWMHRTLRSLNFDPEAGGAAYLRRPRPER